MNNKGIIIIIISSITYMPRPIQVIQMIHIIHRIHMTHMIQ